MNRIMDIIIIMIQKSTNKMVKLIKQIIFCGVYLDHFT